MLQSMGLQRVGHDLVIEQQQSRLTIMKIFKLDTECTALIHKSIVLIASKNQPQPCVGFLAVSKNYDIFPPQLSGLIVCPDQITGTIDTPTFPWDMS